MFLALFVFPKCIIDDGLVHSLIIDECILDLGKEFKSLTLVF